MSLHRNQILESQNTNRACCQIHLLRALACQVVGNDDVKIFERVARIDECSSDQVSILNVFLAKVVHVLGSKRELRHETSTVRGILSA